MVTRSLCINIDKKQEASPSLLSGRLAIHRESRGIPTTTTILLCNQLVSLTLYPSSLLTSREQYTSCLEQRASKELARARALSLSPSLSRSH